MTAGAFDPTLLGAVLRAGYDRSFDTFGAHPARRCRACRPVPLTSSSTRRALRSACRSASGFDPGGIGKGLAADLVAGELLAHGAPGPA